MSAALLPPRHLAGDAIYHMCLLKMLNIHKEKYTDFSLISQYDG